MGGDPSAVGRSITLRGVVASIGAGLGCILGAAVLQGLTGLAENALDLWQPIAMDARAVIAAVAVALVATIIFGLIPALHSTRMAQALTSAGTRTVAGAASHLSRRAAVVVQVALGVMLLVGAGLLPRTFSHLRGLEPGFDGRGVFAASVSLQDARYQPAEDVRWLTDGALERLRDSAGVESAAASLGLPYERLLNLAFRHVDGREA